MQIIGICCQDEVPDLRGYEFSLIRLFDKISNGSEIDMNKSGTYDKNSNCRFYI